MKKYAKFLISFLVLVFFILLFVSYRLDIKKNEEYLKATQGKKLEKIALISTLAGVDDESFCQAAWTAVREFGNKYNIEYQYYMPLSDAVVEISNSVELAVADGATIIVMPSFHATYSLYETHRKYPSVKFIGIDMSPLPNFPKLGKNTFMFTFHEEEVGYLAGYATVIEGYTRLGYIGGMAVTPVIRYGYGFLLGADAAARKLNKKIRVNYYYAGQFFGDANISAKMDGWYSSGTQVIFAAGGTLCMSVLEAAVPYKGMMIGVDTDQHHLGISRTNYDPVLTSAMKNITATVGDILLSAIYGGWDEIGGTHRIVSVKDGDYLGLPTAKESWQFKHFTRQEYNKLLHDIRSDKITINCNIYQVPHLTNTKLHFVE
ncbi:MAG: BMP family ABC transporter substrate-binding protein [Synergistaceae bacterium]|nr:BMP family ABC transporter substrate-binding protein [Synergistaceae bacterium]